jgi:hypothetical protein
MTVMAGSVRTQVQTLRLPRVIGRRDRITELLAAQDVPESLVGETFVVLCRELFAGSGSCADELVRAVVEERGASEMFLVGAPKDFVALVLESAARRHVASRVAVGRAAELGV